MNTLVIHQLSKTFGNGVKALNQVSLEFSNGMFGLLGPNGAGKSTLMQIIAGLQKPDSGGILFNGADVLKDPFQLQKQLGFLPQDFGVYPRVSAISLLDHLAILKGVEHKKERREQVLALLEKVNLYSHCNRDVYTFSGGMRQRFGVAQALLGDPKIIIVDEPTAGLDPEERIRFNDLLCETGENRIVILSTHLVEDVRNLCSQMAVMHQGKVLACGSPDDFIRSLKGRIWLKQMKKNGNSVEELDGQFISARYVSGCKMMHILSDVPPEDAVAVDPGLEDAYFFILKNNTGNESHIHF